MANVTAFEVRRSFVSGEGAKTERRFGRHWAFEWERMRKRDAFGNGSDFSCIHRGVFLVRG